MKLLAPFLLLCIYACSSPSTPKDKTSPPAQKENPAQEAYQRTLQTHDKIMPITSELNRLGRQLKSQIEQLQPKQKELWLSVIDSLDTAEEAMMKWMAEFPAPNSLPDSLTKEEIEQLYRQKENEIKAIGKQMEAARDKAEKLLKN